MRAAMPDPLHDAAPVPASIRTSRKSCGCSQLARRRCER